MPSMHQRRGKRRYPAMPDVKEEFGENPARFVYGGEMMVKGRLPDIDDIELLAAYLRAERAREGGPRRSVIRAIQDRIDDVNQEQA